MNKLVTVIEKFSHDARGIARIAGKTTFIDGALPGERVMYHYTKRSKRYDEARVLEVLEPSPERVVPACAYYGVCGGCSLQHLDSAAQLAVKQALVLDVLHRIAGISPTHVLPPLTSESWQYRDKARWSVQVTHATQCAVGFKKKYQPNGTLSIEHCAVMNPNAARLLQPLHACLQAFTNPQSISAIEVAVGEEGVALIVRLQATCTSSDYDRLLAFAEQQAVLLLMHNSTEGAARLVYPPEHSGYLTYRLPAYQLVLAFHPADFTQINSALNRLMVSQVLDLLALTPDDTVLDLFCGIGNFTLPIARHCRQAIGVEGLPALVSRAEMNARANGIENAQFYCGDLASQLAMPRDYASGANKILLDPPRSGALAVVKQMARLAPERVVYVSCDAATLARDAAVLQAAGYRLATLGVMDMFPQTPHVESVALFLKQR